jgi:hypothetical protein
VTRRRAPGALAVAAVLALAACGDDTAPSGATTTSAGPTTTTVAPTTTSTPAPTTTVVSLSQPTIWPAPETVFTTPEAAANDFVAKVLDVPPHLGEFREGDARSGEIELLSPGEGDAGTAVVRGTILLRRLGPTDGWYVIGVANDNASVTTPDTGQRVAAGPVSVEGRARGFEANVVVTAFVAGHADRVLDRRITQGGAFATPEPFTVTLDLSDAAAGETVVVLVRGGTGLETDPGEVGAIPLVIAG